MKKLLFLPLLFFINISVEASHIVGGEFQLYWKQGYHYALEMNFYYDDIHAETGLLEDDLHITVAIYAKNPGGFDYLVDTVVLKRVSDNFIPYQYVQCTQYNSGKVRTRLLKYVVNNNSQTIELDPSVYNNPNGYYVVWERCCRNASIQNIFSPGYTGQVFYLEFPSLSVLPKDGGYAFNSEPLFKTLTGDFPCVGRPFTFDFSGIDPNGDSLVYSMVTPLAGHADLDLFSYGPEPVPPLPAPYPLVSWNSGYGATNAIHGNPPLSINPHTGILTVTPSDTGLYAFGVICDEYRAGKKIGQVRRDFQFWVIKCPSNPGPTISLQLPDNSIYNETDTIKITMHEKDTCFTALIADSSTAAPTYKSQAITIYNLTTNAPSGLLLTAGVVKIPANTSSSQPITPVTSPVCFNPCQVLNIDKDSLITFTLVVADQSCPRPKTDTLNIKVLFIPPNIPKPSVIFSSLILNDTLTSLSDPAKVQNGNTVHLLTNQTISFDVSGVNKGYTIDLTGNGQGFKFSDYGMNFNSVTGTDSVASQFSWKVLCSAVDKGPFMLRFIASDNSCGLNRADTAYFNIITKDPETTLNEIKPVNIITPNGDMLNDTLTLPNKPIPLPPDNCEYYFKSITIYDRWGGQIYLNTDRNFVWDPNKYGIPDGIYYYLIDLNSKKLKGWIEVIR